MFLIHECRMIIKSKLGLFITNNFSGKTKSDRVNVCFILPIKIVVRLPIQHRCFSDCVARKCILEMNFLYVEYFNYYMYLAHKY